MRPRQRPIFALCVVIGLLNAACGASPPAPPTGSPATPPGESSPPAAPSGSPTLGGLPPLADVPFYRNDVLGHLTEPGPGPSGEPDLVWRASIGKTHWAPILVGGLVVAGTSAGLVVALDARTGAERWRFQAAKPFTTGEFNGSAAAAEGLVFVSDTETTYALDATTGAARWTAAVPSKGSRPVVVDGVVYVGSVGGAMGLDAATGKVVWRWAGPQGVAMTAGSVADGVAYLSSRGDGRLYAINLRDGSERWHVQTISLAVGSSEVVGDTIFVGTNQAEATAPVGEVYAIDRASGKIRWRFRSPAGRQLVVGPVRDGVVYLSSEVDGIYAMRDDGSVATQVWHMDAPPSYFPLSMVGDTLYEQRTDGSIGAYAASDGRLLWQTPATGDDGGGPPLVSGGMVFGLSDTHGVVAFADAALIALLPPAAAVSSPSSTPAASHVPDPFTVIRAFSWSATRLTIPLGMDVGPDGLLYVLDTKPSVTVIDPKDGHVVRTWGRQGAGPGQFDLTRPDDNPGFGDIAVAPGGRVYVADGSNHRVQVFTAGGTYVTQFGSFGAGDGQFGSISEITTGRDGSVYVLDESSNRISKFTADGKLVWRSPAPGSDPDLGNPLHGIAVRADGALLATCEQCGRFLVFDATDGHVRDRIEPAGLDGDLAGPVNLDPAGNICVAVYGSDSELIFDGTGKLLGGLYHQPGTQLTNIGNGHIEWGDTFWPSPVFLPDGRGFTFWKDGLIELKVPSLSR